jgi:2-oxoisovalerate dehydrogenase E2 component (dihydrolipoyl transacylase)
VIVTMPKLGESVTEGVLGRWLKAPGDEVGKYEPLVEVTTDKVTAEVPSPVAGRLTAVLAPEGATVAVGEPLCEIEEVGAAAATEPPPPAAPASPSPEPPPALPPAGPRVRSSPYVRRLAREAGVDLADVPTERPDGRVTRADLERYLAARRPAPTPTASPAPAPAPAAPAPGDTVLELTPMRRAIAEHMVRSKHTAPHATAWFEVDMSAVVAARERLRAEFETREGVPLTYLPFVVLAAVEGLRRFPIVNSAWEGDRIVLKGAIHVGIAVAVPDGLVVPVVKHADRYSLAGLARILHDLITRARSGKLTMDDVTGGTFTVNNPGAYGSVLSTPIIHQPQAAILSMEAIVRRPVVVGDAIAIRPMMNLSMSFDHRILDGAVACQFLRAVKDRLESADGWGV